MDKLESLKAVKKAIGGEFFSGSVNVLVQNSNHRYLYSNIYVGVSYNISYMQMDVNVIWGDDSKQPAYSKLGLHGKYNSNFYEFSCSDGTLTWKDGNNTISVFFNKK